MLFRVMCALTIVGSFVVVGAGSAAASTRDTSTSAPIIVGFQCTCSGAGGYGAFLQDGEKIYQAWANTVNASGGIDGHKVQIITEDDAGTPGTSVSDVQTLIADHVDVIVDQSLLDAAWESAVQTAKIPVVGSNETSAPFGSNPDFYPEGTTEDASLAGVVHVAKEAGVKKLSIFYCAAVVTCLQSLPIFSAVGKQVGTPVVYKAAISTTAPNYTAPCVASQQAGADGVMAGQVSAINVVIAKDCVQQGYHPIYITQGAGYGALEASATGLKTNLWSEFDDIPEFAKTPGVQTMNAALDKYYPGLRKNAQLYQQLDVEAWEAGLLLETAAKAGGLTASQTPSSAEVLKGLNSLTAVTLGGMAPPLTFKADQAHVIKCWFVGHIKNGVASVANGAKVTCP